MADDTRVMVEARRGVPTGYAEGSRTGIRATKYGEPVVAPLGRGAYTIADEGRYFVLRNGTPGTGLAGHAAPTTIDDLKPLLHLKNDYTAADAKRIYLDYIKLDVTAAGTNAVSLFFAHKHDPASRYTSGGTALTAINVNGDSSETASVTAYFGAVVAPAAGTSVRLLAHGGVRPSVIPVVGDTYRFVFGHDGGGMGSMVQAGTAIADITVPCPPIIIAPGATYLLHQASASQSGAHSFEVEVGFWVR